MSLKGVLGLVGTGIGVLVLLIGFMVFVEKVPEGKVAVVYSPSNGAKEILNPGWHLIGLLEKTQEYPTRVTIVKDNISVTTEDGKKITMPVRYEMKVDKSKVLDIFKELGSQKIEQIQEGYLAQKLFKSAREVVSGYSVLDIYGTKTSEASAKVTELMAKESDKLGFIIADVTLGTPELDENTQKAIDARVQASQELEKLKLEKQIATEQAEKKRIEAKGTADAKIEKAKGESEANKLLSNSITPELLKLKEMEARMEHGWVSVQGANTTVVKE